jgi:N-acetyl-gamma-glutamyl-phosphate reductase
VPATSAGSPFHRRKGGDMAVVLVVEDNLVKGAPAKAIQNMNLMFDLPETMGLTAPPV